MSIMRAVRVATTVGVVALAPSLASAQSPTAVVNKAVAAWSKVQSLSGTFEQSLTNPLMRTTSTARGEFRQQQPNKLAVRFTDPAGDAIISDGKFLWLYLQQAAPGQVIKRPAADADDIPFDAGKFLSAPASKYDIVDKGPENVGTRPARVLALTPKKGTSAPFSRATVWVDDADGLIRQFEVVESSGLIRRIRMNTLVMNPRLTAADFKFVVPKGVKVVTP